MNSFALAILILLVVYQLKHFTADYLLQGEYMLGKFKPGWDFLGPLIAHVTVHGVFTFLIAAQALQLLDHNMASNTIWAWAAGLAALDATIHFFMDRIKASPKYLGRWKAISGSEYVEIKKQLDPLEPYNQAAYPESWTGPDGKNPMELYHALHARLRGNRNFWWALGFDQMIHHLTHYALIYMILHIAGF